MCAKAQTVSDGHVVLQTKRLHKKFEPTVRVWKLKEEQTCEVEQEEWKHLDVNEHWHKIKNIIMETVQHICGL